MYPDYEDYHHPEPYKTPEKPKNYKYDEATREAAQAQREWINTTLEIENRLPTKEELQLLQTLLEVIETVLPSE